MSWSVQAVGKPEAVVKKLATEFEKITYLAGVEAELKDAVDKLVAVAVSAYTGSYAVRVTASGSASNYKEGVTQSLNLLIEPIYGFIE